MPATSTLTSKLCAQGWRFAADGKCTDVPQALDAKANAQVTAACAWPVRYAH